MKGIFDFTVVELYFIAETLGFSQGHFNGINYPDKSLKEILTLQLSAIASYNHTIPSINRRNLNFDDLRIKLNKITENNLQEIKSRFNVYSNLSVISWKSGVPMRLSEIDRLMQAGLIFETEEIAA